MKKKTEPEKLIEASANTAAAADHHETCRQRALACRETAKTAEADSHHAFEAERAQRALLANQADEPTSEQVDELKRLAVLAAESRVVADLATSRAQAADKALAEASKVLRQAQRVEAEIAFHLTQLELAGKIIELAPLHERWSCPDFVEGVGE